jgi:tRNA pseudouridine55 synthase
MPEMSRLENRGEIDGALVVDKPSGPTSHDIVAMARRAIGCKVGHAGTLDPAATGVLVLLLGRATRLSQFVSATDKEYLALVRLGIVTNTYDADGLVLEESPVPVISEEEAERSLDRFRGTILQVPPMFSAVKVRGEPLYKAARRSEEVERASREVVVHRIVLEDRSEFSWRLRIACSSGTYVRSIAHDLGQLLGCGAMLEELRRVRAGEFRIERAVPVEALQGEWRAGFVPLDRLLTDLPELELAAEQARRTVNGNPVHPDGEGGGQGLIRLTYGGRLLAIGEFEGVVVAPKVVLRSEVTPG